MNSLLRLALALAQSANALSQRRAAARLMVMTSLGVAALGSGLAVLGCLLAALWIAVDPHLGAALATLLIAGIVAILTAAMLAIMRRRRTFEAEASRGEDLPAVFVAEAQALLAGNKGAVLLAGVLAGFVLSKRDAR